VLQQKHDKNRPIQQLSKNTRNSQKALEKAKFQSNNLTKKLNATVLHQKHTATLAAGNGDRWQPYSLSMLSIANWHLFLVYLYCTLYQQNILSKETRILIYPAVRLANLSTEIGVNKTHRQQARESQLPSQLQIV